MPDHKIVASQADLEVGDSLYQEQTGRTYWVDELSRDRIKLLDVDGSAEVWVTETLEQAFDAHTWVRQSRSPTQRMQRQ